MPRNRVIYQCEDLLAGPSPATGRHYDNSVPYGQSPVTGGSGGSGFGQPFTGANLVRQLYRIQSANYSFSKNLVNVNQYGELAEIDRIPLQQPTVTLDFSYLLANFQNEDIIGFTVSSGSMTSAISGILNKTDDERNYFIRTAGEGDDTHGADDHTDSVIGIGNAVLASYTAEGQVGNFPKATVSLEGLNMEFYNSTTGRIPAVFPASGTNVTGWFFQLPAGTQNTSGLSPINSQDNILSVLRPGDITLQLGYDEGGAALSDLKVQRFQLSFNPARQSLEKLGSKFAFSKEITFPTQVDLTVESMMGDLTTGSLVEIISNNTSYNPSVTIRKPGTNTVICYYELRSAKLDTQSFTSSIGQNKSVTWRFSSQLGGPQSTAGLRISGQI